MQKIYNIMLALSIMMFIISCSDDSNSVQADKTVKGNLVLIPAGPFSLGNTGSYEGEYDEKPPVTIIISKPFYISKYEITQQQYKAVMGNKPSEFKGDDLPVEQVSWYDALNFCNTLSQSEGLTPCYTINGTKVTCDFEANGYRLPTEAEWEYAAKAGTKTDFYSGKLTYSGNSPIDPNLDKIAWYSANSSNATHPVGQKAPNAFGLYDMSGNVWEWCWDRYAEYPSKETKDYQGPEIGTYRVYRGGGWRNLAWYCRSTNRDRNYLDDKNNSLGFRVVKAK